VNSEQALSVEDGRVLMTDVSYDRAITGLLVIDPYNDFISEGGKIWPRIKAVAEANGCVPHMSKF
jgi:ureidoacrylate peracid hydrolase